MGRYGMTHSEILDKYGQYEKTQVTEGKLIYITMTKKVKFIKYRPILKSSYYYFVE